MITTTQNSCRAASWKGSAAEQTQAAPTCRQHVVHGIRQCSAHGCNCTGTHVQACGLWPHLIVNDCLHQLILQLVDGQALALLQDAAAVLDTKRGGLHGTQVPTRQHTEPGRSSTNTTRPLLPAQHTFRAIIPVLPDSISESRRAVISPCPGPPPSTLAPHWWLSSPAHAAPVGTTQHNTHTHQQRSRSPPANASYAVLLDDITAG